LADSFEPGANLVISGITLPAGVPAKQTGTLTYTVTNEGARSTEVSAWQDEVYLSTDGILDGAGDTLLQSIDHDGTLAPSQSYTNSVSYTVPDGNAFIIVRTDVADAIQEGDGESDNTAVRSAVASGPPIAFGGKSVVRFTDSDGDAVTVSLKGPGT